MGRPNLNTDNFDLGDEHPDARELLDDPIVGSVISILITGLAGETLSLIARLDASEVVVSDDALAAVMCFELFSETNSLFTREFADETGASTLGEVYACALYYLHRYISLYQNGYPEVRICDGICRGITGVFLHHPNAIYKLIEY